MPFKISLHQFKLVVIPIVTTKKTIEKGIRMVRYISMQKTKINPGVVAHMCNLSYLGIGGRRIMSLKST
jgi:hypothetical protein